jgi:hypothetical protein
MYTIEQSSQCQANRRREDAPMPGVLYNLFLPSCFVPGHNVSPHVCAFLGTHALASELRELSPIADPSYLSSTCECPRKTICYCQCNKVNGRALVVSRLSGTVSEAEAEEEKNGLAQIKHRIRYPACPRSPRATGELATVAPRAQAGAGQAMARLFSNRRQHAPRLQIHERKVLVTRSGLPLDWRRGGRP